MKSHIWTKVESLKVILKKYRKHGPSVKLRVSEIRQSQEFAQRKQCRLTGWNPCLPPGQPKTRNQPAARSANMSWSWLSIRSQFWHLACQCFTIRWEAGCSIVLNEYFRYLTQQEILVKNPMNSVPMIKKSNFMAAQNKEDLPTQETVTVFTSEEIEKFKAEAFSKFSNGKPKYQQPAAYILMLNTGLRTGKLLGLLNSDINLEGRYLEVHQNVKEVCRREGTEYIPGREVKVGKTKTATSKRRVPLNGAAVAAIEELRQERNFGPTAPLVSDEKGDYTRPVNFRKRYYRILKAAGIEQKGLHSLRHHFATQLINGVKQPDGTIKALSPRQVADLLGHSTSQITEMYYVKKDTTRLQGITDGFNF